jgi:hypothetical protein
MCDYGIGNRAQRADHRRRVTDEAAHRCTNSRGHDDGDVKSIPVNRTTVRGNRRHGEISYVGNVEDGFFDGYRGLIDF